jgi:acylphosphatase
MIRRTVFFSGRVQGVGFRYTAQSLARKRPVSGYVKNLSDGRVEAVVEGERTEVDRFIAEISREMAGYIRDTASQEGAATGQFTGFEVRY